MSSLRVAMKLSMKESGISHSSHNSDDESQIPRKRNSSFDDSKEPSISKLIFFFQFKNYIFIFNFLLFIS